MRCSRSDNKKILVLAIVASITLLPYTAHAATSSSGSTTFNATVNSTISISSSSTVAIALTPTSGGVVSSAADTISVSTNNSTGYTLTLSDADSVTNLTNGSNTIPAHAGTQASPTTLAVNSWGYRTVGVGGFGATAYSAELNNTNSSSTWAGVPATGSANTLKNTSATATNDTTSVYYGVKVNTIKPTGVYADVVTYTAITN